MIHDPLSPASEESVVVRAGQMLFRRRTLALVVFATVMASAVSFAVYLPDLYQASALVLVERQVSEALVKPGASGELESRLQIIKQEILSRARLTELINASISIRISGSAAGWRRSSIRAGGTFRST